MSANVNKTWHLSAEARWILVNLRDAIQYNLLLDEVGNSSDFTGHHNLFPVIYHAFIKIWCRKIPFCVRKKSYTPAHCMDVPMVLLPVDTYEKFRSAYFREVGAHSPSLVDAVHSSNVDELPF